MGGFVSSLDMTYITAKVAPWPNVLVQDENQGGSRESHLVLAQWKTVPGEATWGFSQTLRLACSSNAGWTTCSCGVDWTACSSGTAWTTCSHGAGWTASNKAWPIDWDSMVPRPIGPKLEGNQTILMLDPCLTRDKAVNSWGKFLVGCWRQLMVVIDNLVAVLNFPRRRKGFNGVFMFSATF